ncbi:hypothetical protein CAOG_005979 [Capsaspora owczarzaki ATCC 30864]|uniref:Uncharacterized protein n=1 Tax=Capsaspora owczarzaki (strain ATCC 30864) TaxID=595528 RepID=A0A0D2WT52_CAPO3|nr:hypothetical protein CAOG_005979 [Capsaspora owczarzaki ATCC 30864]
MGLWQRLVSFGAQSAATPILQSQSKHASPLLRHIAPAAARRAVALVDPSSVAVSWGDGSFGQCGSGEAHDAIPPLPLAVLTAPAFRVAAVAAGLGHAVALVDELNPLDKSHPHSTRQSLFSWQLGTDDQHSSIFDEDEEDFPVPRRLTSTPLRVELLSETTESSNARTAATTTTTTTTTTTAELENSPRTTAAAATSKLFRDVSAGFFHTALLSTSGRVACWGAGLLGHGDALNDGALRIVRGLPPGMRLLAAGGYQTVAWGPAGIFLWGWLASPKTLPIPNEPGTSSPSASFQLTHRMLKAVSPMRVTALDASWQVSHAACGHSHTALVLTAPNDATNQHLAIFGRESPEVFSSAPIAPLFAEEPGLDSLHDSLRLESTATTAKYDSAYLDQLRVLHRECLTPRVIPVDASVWGPVRRLASGNGFTVVLFESGRLASITRHGDREKQDLVPLSPLPDKSTVVDVACAAGSVIAVSSNGMVFATDDTFGTEALPHHEWHAICQRAEAPLTKAAAGAAFAIVF